MCQKNVVEKIKTRISCSVTTPPPEIQIRAFYETMCTDMVVLDRPQMKIPYGACALHAGYARLQTHAQNM